MFIVLCSLTTTNWYACEPLMIAYLCSCGEYRLVSGMLQRPSPPSLLVAAIDTQGHDIAFTADQQMHNSKLQTSYDDVKGLEGNAPGMWAASIAVHFQQAPGTQFSAYNELFGVVKGPNELLTHLVSCVSDAMGHIQELSPATNFDIVKLDEELQLMAMLRALPCVEYGDFTSSLMRTEKLTLTHAKAAFHIEETECNAIHGPLIAPAGDAALFTSLLSNSSKASTSKDLCIVCGQGNHPLEKCFDLIKAKELRAEHQKSYNKDQRACRAAGTPATAPAVVEAALTASLRSSTPSGPLADAHWIADTGATSHMTPHRSWFIQ
jgi:hypothetical protein